MNKQTLGTSFQGRSQKFVLGRYNILILTCASILVICAFQAFLLNMMAFLSSIMAYRPAVIQTEEIYCNLNWFGFSCYVTWLTGVCEKAVNHELQPKVHFALGTLNYHSSFVWNFQTENGISSITILTSLLYSIKSLLGLILGVYRYTASCYAPASFTCSTAVMSVSVHCGCL